MELHTRSTEANGFDQCRAPRQNRAQREDALAGGFSWSRKDDDDETSVARFNAKTVP